MIPTSYDSECCHCGRMVKAGLGFLVGPPWRTYCSVDVPNKGVVKRIQDVSRRFKAWRHADMAPYQKRGATWLAGRQGGILGDEQGLGKTIQAVTAIPESATAVVVCPAVAKGVWFEHITKLRPDLKPMILEGRNSWVNGFPPGRVAIINYDIIPELFLIKNALAAPENLICDEVHYLKGLESIRTRKVSGLAGKVLENNGRLWFIGGTPIKNTPDDLWSILTVLRLAEETFGSYKNYKKLLGGKSGAWGKVDWEGDIDPTVPNILRRVMLRRHKSDVLPELPPRRWETVRVDIPGPARRMADKAVKTLRDIGVDIQDLTADALENSDSIAFETMSRVCKSLAVAKIPALMAMLNDIEAQDPAPPLVWSRHVAPLKVVASRPGWACLHGGTTEKGKAKMAEGFQEGLYRGLAMSQSGATALTLTRAWHAIFLDRFWSPADNEQAEDRIHRLSQDQAVLYTTLVADHIIDERTAEILGAKGRIIGGVIRAAATKEN